MTRKRRGRGEGGICRRGDGIWQGSISLGYDKSTGKRQRRFVYGSTKSEVIQKLRRLDPNVQPAARTTVAEYVQDWVEIIRASRAPSTYRRYEQLSRLYVEPYLRVSLDKLTAAHVEEWLQALQDKNVTASNRHKALTLLRTAMTDAVKKRYISHNVARDVAKPKVEHMEMHVWTAEETRRFLDVAKDTRLHALYRLAIDATMREGELFGLRWDDIDFAAGVVHVKRALEENGATLRIKSPKTKGSRRNITVSPSTLEALHEHRKRMLREGTRSPYIFVDTVGNWLRRSNVHRRDFYPLMDKAEVPRIRFHDLRHTAITLLLQSGENPKVVAERAGHADVKVTLAVYSHVLPTMQKSAADKMQTLLG